MDTAHRGSTPKTLCSAEQVQVFVTRLYRAAGVPEEHLPVLADYYVETSLQGLDSHALWMLPLHVGDVLRGKVNPAPDLRVDGEGGPCAKLDGDNGPGIVVAARAMGEATIRAARHGVGVVAVRGGNHFAAATHYALLAVQRGLIGVVMSNAVAHMAPWGARTPLIANNPLAIGVPAGNQMPLVLDIAMSTVARGRIIQAAEEGWPTISPGWALDDQGQPITDPKAAVHGLLRPMGDHKGSGLAVVIGAICAALPGANFDNSISIDSPEPRNTGHLMIALDPGVFGPAEAFAARVDTWISTLYSSELARGVQRMHLPGHGKLGERERRLREGIPMTDHLLRKLDDLAERVGVESLKAEGGKGVTRKNGTEPAD